MGLINNAITTIKKALRMEEDQQDFLELIKAGNIDKAKDQFNTRVDTVEKSLDQYNIEKHEINDRRDKIVEGKEPIKQWRLPIPYQKKIVKSAVAFLFGKPVRLIQQSEGTDESFEILLELWKDMRMASKNREVARKLFSETEVAKLFVEYRDTSITDEEVLKNPGLVRVKCIILAKSLGDNLYTKFNEVGVMEAFARGYIIEIGSKKIEHFDVYTPNETIYTYKNGADWTVEESIPNKIGKIPVVYYKQDFTEWSDVQPLIDRLEWLQSTRADTNDYSADPILVLKGGAVVASLPEKQQTGKVVQLDTGADATYLSPEMAIDMVKDERESLKELIHYCTDTPDLSLDKMSAIGTTSGKAMELLFFSPLLKAMDKQELFEEMLDREINILKAFIGNVISIKDKAQTDNLEVGVEFGNPLPDNVEEVVNMLNLATSGKAILSQQTALSLNPLVKDSDQEFIRIREEEASINTGDE